ncbi:MAG: HAD family hydrolase [Ruminococcus sp.]
MNKIKLIGVDLDGTTLNQKKQISQENIDTFRLCKEKGIHIVPVTGRPLSGLYNEYKKQIGCRYSIHTNGAVVMDLEKGEYVFHHPLSINTAGKVIDILNKYNCYYGIFYDGYGYLDSEDYFNELKKHENTSLYEYIKASRKKVHNQMDFLNSIEYCDNIYVIAKSPEIRLEIYNALKNVKDIYYTCSEECDVEIGSLCSKGTSLLELAESLGINQSEVMAIGDSGNDLNMLELAGFSVAMENSSKNIIDTADYVTKSCEESGVAYAIKKFCL